MAPTRPKHTLVSVPDELLTLILLELQLCDLLSIRRVCRHLNAISSGASVWRRLFEQSLGVTIPRPFFLPKTLKSASSRDIEGFLRKWHQYWRPVHPVQFFKRPIRCADLPEPITPNDTSIITPGGRWIISGYRDGSVWYIDLGHDPTSTTALEPQLLVPASLPDDTDDIQIKIALDFSSGESLGQSVDHHTLRQFNVAVVTSSSYDDPLPLNIDVWRVHVCTELGDPASLTLGPRLSNFTEEGDVALVSVGLHGRSVAYSILLDHTKCVVVVDWMEADGKGKDEQFTRWYLPLSRANSIHLLPEDQILTTDNSDNAALFNWRKDCPSSTLRPSEQDLDHVSPFYHRAMDQLIYFDAISPPTILRCCVQVVIPADEEAIRVDIPLGPDADTDSIRTISILKHPPYELAGRLRVFGHRRAIGLSGDYVLTVIHYSPEDGTGGNGSPTRVQSFEFPELTKLENPPDRLLYDEFSQRIVLIDADVSYVLTVDTSSIAEQ
ncbi:hypothetical protein FA13DRAFT_1010835 [Coprinellus micaceus]|uniref:F-box domain-containing protein n=1 Tax=Coprinellus micaceus TaxID=71717 RepID=A0A4Y7SY30_COPMI|nr:hypothetical protein FA13DRAFT_1010835 [Coprinellus micaceus]